MWAISKEECIDSHVKASLVHEIHITYSCCPNGNGRTCTNSHKHAGDQDSSPSSAVTRNHVADASEEVPEEVDRPATIHVRQRCYKQRPNTSEYYIDGQFI